MIQKSSVPKPQPNGAAENSSTIERILQRPLNKKQYLANKDLVALLKANEEKENVKQAPAETQAIMAKQLKQNIKGINGGISDLVKQI